MAGRAEADEAMIIDIRFIPHDRQRYPTVGDWQFSNHAVNPNLTIRVSKLSDWRYEWLVALHELIEAMLCHLMGVTEKDVDAYDTAYEEARAVAQGKNPKAPCGCRIQDEPGNDKHCPVYRQHQVATLAERAMAKILGVRWRDYDAEVESL